MCEQNTAPATGRGFFFGPASKALDQSDNSYMIMELHIGIAQNSSQCREKTSMPSISSIRTQDVRFPTSLELDGSDAVNVDPDYSAAYVVIRTDAGDEGHGFVFSCGRGNEVIEHHADAAFHARVDGADRRRLDDFEQAEQQERERDPRE